MNEICGREIELGLVDRFVQDLSLGPSALLIRGRPGIGKTILWLHGVDSAIAAGHRVLSSRSVQAEAKMSFTTLGDLLDDVYEETAPDLPEPQRRALEAALLRGGSGARPDRRAVAVATSAVLRALAAQAPVLIAVDDVQWIDSASGKVMSFALRRLGREAVGVLATQRVERGSTDPLGLRLAFGDPTLTSMDIGPLDVAPMSQLLRGRLEPEIPYTMVTRIHAVCEGNPLFALEIGRAGALQGWYCGALRYWDGTIVPAP